MYATLHSRMDAAPTVQVYVKKPVNFAQSLENFLKSRKIQEIQGKNYENQLKFREKIAIESLTSYLKFFLFSN